MVKALHTTWITWRYLPLPAVRLHLRQLRKHWRVYAIALTAIICLPISLGWQERVPSLASAQMGMGQIRLMMGQGVQPAAAEPANTTPPPQLPAVSVLPLGSSPTGQIGPPSVPLPAPARKWYNGYAYGHCTYYVANRRPVPQGWGNARNWYTAAQRSGYKVGLEPQVGSIAWTPSGWYGHVAYVEQVEGQKVLIAEMNYAGWNRVSRRWVTASAFKYIY